MRGPIDYIVVAFEGNQFKGEILKELEKAVSDNTISVLDLAVIAKDSDGNVQSIELSNIDSELIKQISANKSGQTGLITDEDVEEIGEILAEDCSAGLLIIEQVWAKGLKQAIINANGELLAEGRIHPEADKELNEKGGK